MSNFLLPWSAVFGAAAKLAVVMVGLASPAQSAPPPTLVRALEYLRDQKSYSWEVINSDPGPVAQQYPTRRGSVTLVQQNTSPHIKGSIDRNGDMLIEREWADGLRLDMIVTADGAVVTHTPEGWMTNTEILTGLADERMSDKGPTPRYVWLRRADRPDLRRPDQELLPLLKLDGPFENSGDTYTVAGRLPSSGAGGGDNSGPPAGVTLNLNLSNGVIRDYEVIIEATRSVGRARVQMPVGEQRIVILTYIPVSRIVIPPEAREKLMTAGAK